MKQIAKFGFNFLMGIVVLDLMILFAGLGQIAMENRTGEWNPFWKWQAQQVVRLIGQR